MSMATLERAITAGAREVFKNKKLRTKDILEWNTGEIKAQANESTAFIPDPGVYVTIEKALDKR
jgi:hypothetical protein